MVEPDVAEAGVEGSCRDMGVSPGRFSAIYVPAWSSTNALIIREFHFAAPCVICPRSARAMKSFPLVQLRPGKQAHKPRHHRTALAWQKKAPLVRTGFGLSALLRRSVTN